MDVEDSKREEGAYASEQRLHLFLSIFWKEEKERRERGRGRERAWDFAYFSFLLLLSFRRDGFGWLGRLLWKRERKHACFLFLVRVCT